MDTKKSAQVIDLKARKGHLMREPFIPLTGNPENGDYLDWFRHLEEGDTFNFNGENI